MYHIKSLTKIEFVSLKLLKISVILKFIVVCVNHNGICHHKYLRLNILNKLFEAIACYINL